MNKSHQKAQVLCPCARGHKRPDTPDTPCSAGIFTYMKVAEKGSMWVYDDICIPYHPKQLSASLQQFNFIELPCPCC